ncbi:MAG: phosphatidylinositol-3-phosphatase [Vulcanimicrobiaceae bacterium]
MLHSLARLARLLIVAAFAASVMPTTARAALAPPKHVVVVVEENKSFGQIVGNARAPYINALARRGALFTNSHGVTHPSLPNYLALFAGVTNVNGDGCPPVGLDRRAPNLGSELIAAHRTFAAYSEALPSVGSQVCAAGTYARKHAPWVAFDNVPKGTGHRFALPASLDALPTVAFVIPDVDDDMHDGTIARGDAWLAKHLGPLVRWADSHDTLVVLTWDEGFDADNTIATVLYGPMIKPGTYAQRISHYNVLRTIEDLYALAPSGQAAKVAPIAGCWR